MHDCDSLTLEPDIHYLSLYFPRREKVFYINLYVVRSISTILTSRIQNMFYILLMVNVLCFCLFAKNIFILIKIRYLFQLARKRLAMDTISLKICPYVNEITKSCM